MFKLSIVFMFLPIISYAQDMQRTVTKAIMAMPEVKRVVKTVTNETIETVEDITTLDKNTLGTFGAIALAGAQGRVSTRSLKLKVDTIGGGTMTPVADYNFRSGESSTRLMFNWSW